MLVIIQVSQKYYDDSKKYVLVRWKMKVCWIRAKDVFFFNDSSKHRKGKMKEGRVWIKMVLQE